MWRWLREGRRLLPLLPASFAIVLVLAAYGFYASRGTFSFPRLMRWQVWEESNYATLAEGFRNGHLSLERGVDPKLRALPFPWDPAAREGIFYPWDTSYYNGRFYLYFTAVPVVSFYLPFRWMAGGYPPDALAAAVFAAWGFLAAVAFTRRALTHLGRPPLLPFPLWVLFIGAGNAIPFVLTQSRTYEVAIITGMAMSATWALAMLRFLEQPTGRRAAWCSLWLALAIASRPNLGVLLLTALVVLFVELRRRPDRLRVATAFAAPLAVVAVVLAAYNVARFGSPFELGVRYQLTTVSMADQRVCSLCTLPEVGRIINHSLQYVFVPPAVTSEFPFVGTVLAKLDPAVSWPTPNHGTEDIVGIGALVPLTLVGTFAAVLLALMRGRSRSAGARAALYVIGSGWLVLFSLSSCWWIVTRYSLDFLLLIVIGSVVCVEAAAVHLEAAGVRIVPLRLIAGALVCYSVAGGVLLGFVRLAEG
ncbi:MAG TPA: hypothetical protein VGF48_25890 [Thermoanaerobaculia bacterium]|jgi:hypothetical protein